MQAPVNPIILSRNTIPLAEYERRQNNECVGLCRQTEFNKFEIYQHLSDFDLCRAIKQNDKNAFDEIYRRYWKSLLNLAYSKLRDKEACMDIVQELFISFWNHRNSDIEIQAVFAYLCAGVKFKIANLIRHNKVKEGFFIQAKNSRQKQFTQSDEFETKQLKEVIARFTQDLPKKCKQIYFMSRNEFLSNKEIARKLNISEKTVEKQITIALKKLRGYLRMIL